MLRLGLWIGRTVGSPVVEIDDANSIASLSVPPLSFIIKSYVSPETPQP